MSGETAEGRPVLSVEKESPWSRLFGCFATAAAVGGALFYFLDLPPWLPLVVTVGGALVVFGSMLAYRQLLLTAKSAGLRVAGVPRDGEAPPFPWLPASSGAPAGGFVLHGERDGFRVSFFVEKRREGPGASGSTTSLRGIVWELPTLDLPELYAHGPERHWQEVLSEGFWQTLTGEPTPEGSALDAKGRRRIRPSNAVPGFLERVEVWGGPEAQSLLTEGIQQALLSRPRAGQLECRGPFVRWEEKGEIGRRTTADVDRLVEETLPLRDAILTSGTFGFLAPESPSLGTAGA